MVTCINTAQYHNIANLPGNYIQYKCTQRGKYIKTPPTNTPQDTLTNTPQDINTNTITETNTESQT